MVAHMGRGGDAVNEHASALQAETALSKDRPAPAADERPQRPDLSGLKSFHFHQLISLIEMQQKMETGQTTGAPIGRPAKPADEIARFRATRSLSFGPGDISHVSQGDERL